MKEEEKTIIIDIIANISGKETNRTINLDIIIENGTAKAHCEHTFKYGGTHFGGCYALTKNDDRKEIIKAIKQKVNTILDEVEEEIKYLE